MNYDDMHLQHPVITNMELTGYPDGKEPTYPHCPICQRECETIYLDKDGNIVGCDECVDTRDAWDVEKCFPEEDCE